MSHEAVLKALEDYRLRQTERELKTEFTLAYYRAQGVQPCEHCLSLEGVEKQGCMTRYEDDPDFYWLCAPCREDYEEYWQERWDEYYSGLL